MASTQWRKKELELGWNGAFSKPLTPRRSITVSDEIREFIMSSSSGADVQSLLSADAMLMEQQRQQQQQNPLRNAKKGNSKKGNTHLPELVGGEQQGKIHKKLLLDITNSSNSSSTLAEGGANVFGTIATAFGFLHHSGTDRSLELQVLKQILIRESLVMKLAHLHETARAKAGSAGLKPAAGKKILESMTQLRNVTVDFCEKLMQWRGSVRGGVRLRRRCRFCGKGTITL